MQSFSHAISNLELNDQANMNMDKSFLDVAIFVSLSILELILHCRIIEGKDVPMSNREAEEVDRGDWDKLLIKQNRTALKFLYKIDELEVLQKTYDSPEELYTQDFANKSRRGLRVIPFEFIR